VILDTNAISALARKSPTLIAQLQHARRLAVTLFSLGEFAYGIRHSSVRRELELWMRNRFLARAEVLSPDISTVDHYADIRSELRQAGTPIPANDVWIAALVRQHDLPIISLDRHFDHVRGLSRLEW
jgi:predicted nucleic acid-binding protein